MGSLRRYLVHLSLLSVGIAGGCSGDQFVAVGPSVAGAAGVGGTTSSGGSGGATADAGASGSTAGTNALGGGGTAAGASAGTDQGGAAGSGLASGGGQAGSSAIACTTDQHCPLPVDECHASSCDTNSKTCSTTPLSRTLADAEPGDCHTSVCIDGTRTSIVDTTDLPSPPSNPCKVPVCTDQGTPDVRDADDGGSCTLPPSATGTCQSGACAACAAGTKGCDGDTPTKCQEGQVVPDGKCQGETPHCMGSGECVACATDSDCASGNPCAVATCSAKHVCEISYASGKDVDTNPDDCVTKTCDASGKVTVGYLPRGTWCKKAGGKLGVCTGAGDCYSAL